MKRSWLLLTALLVVGTSAFGFQDEEIGVVKAFKRTIAIDFDKCKEGYTTSGGSYGLCVVRFEAKDDLPSAGNELHVHKKYDNASHTVALEGFTDHYVLDFSATGMGKTDWATAETYLKRFVDEELGGAYSLTVTKVAK